jgi:hypothetical protein
LGNSKTKEAVYQVLKCPQEIGFNSVNKFLDAKKKIFEDCLYSVAAVPEV